MPLGGESKASRELWFKEALRNLSGAIKRNGASVDSKGNKITIGFPHGIGCGLAGGNWVNYRRMIHNFAKEVPGHKVIIVKLP